MDSGSLADLIAGDTLPPPVIAYISGELIEALRFLHAGKKIHRDVKSDNVLLHSDGSVKLADFVHCTQLTELKPTRNAVVGTPYWMAPEVIRGDRYDTKADIWSLAVVIYEMILKNPPYIEYPPLKAVFMIATYGIPPLPDSTDALLMDFIQNCAVMNPEERPLAAQLLKVNLFCLFQLNSGIAFILDHQIFKVGI